MKPLLVVVLALHVAFAAAAKPSPTDLLERFEYNNVQISPTGEYLAAAKMEGEDSRFAIYKMPERKLTYSSNLGEKTEVAQMIWVNDDYFVVSPAQRIFRDVKVRTGELMSINAKTSKFQRLSLKDCPRCGGSILHTLPDDPKHIIVQGSFDQYGEAYLVNVYNGIFRKIVLSVIVLCVGRGATADFSLDRLQLGRVATAPTTRSPGPSSRQLE